MDRVPPRVRAMVGHGRACRRRDRACRCCSSRSRPGVLLRGVIVGLLGALVALGMALIYRANRILNFAQADLGVVPDHARR